MDGEATVDRSRQRQALATLRNRRAAAVARADGDTSGIFIVRIYKFRLNAIVRFRLSTLTNWLSMILPGSRSSAHSLDVIGTSLSWILAPR